MVPLTKPASAAGRVPVRPRGTRPDVGRVGVGREPDVPSLPLGLSIRNKSDETVCLWNRERRMLMMKQSVITTARLLEEQWAGVRHQVVMVTLTYRPGVAWEPYHITTFCQWVYRWARRIGIEVGYDWVMELTAAGVPHYHVLIWLPLRCHLPMADKAGWWRHGMTRTERARNAVGYIAKYASKGEWGNIPIGARINGAGGLEEKKKAERRWWRLPRYVRERFSIADDVTPCCGGGYVSRVSGELVRSEWVLVSCGRGYVRLARRPPDRDAPAAAN